VLILTANDSQLHVLGDVFQRNPFFFDGAFCRAGFHEQGSARINPFQYQNPKYADYEETQQDAE
jgi:hypothetical protein